MGGNIKDRNTSRRSAQEDRELFINIMESLSLVQKKIILMMVDGYTDMEICKMEEITLDVYEKEIDMIKVAIRGVID